MTFKLRSGNTTPFKKMGSSPVKELSGMFQNIAEAEPATVNFDALTDPIEKAVEDIELSEEEKEEKEYKDRVLEELRLKNKEELELDEDN